MKRTNELSNMQCEKAAPKATPYKLSDKGGLNLVVTPAGGKLWRWHYRFEGKQKLMALGKYPDVSLAMARVQHAQARVLLAAGTDPMVARKEVKAENLAERVEAAKPASEPTFEELVRRWFKERWKKGKCERYAADVESRLKFDVISKIGHKRPADITSLDLVEMTTATDSRGARDIAKRNLQIVRKVFHWSKVCGYLPKTLMNPAADIDPNDILTDHVSLKYPHLKIDEVPELLRKMRDYNGHVLTRIAMDLLSLTFVRTGELIQAEWTEIDWENRLWRVPGEHMKMKHPHLVPLATQTIALLERLHHVSGESGRLFPDYNGGTGVMSKNTILKALERMGYKKRMTGHGWRHIASTYLNEKNWDERWVDAQLAHKKPGVAGVYNEAIYISDRVRMMQAWADAIDKMREAGTGKMQLVRNVA
jgi:integrase